MTRRFVAVCLVVGCCGWLAGCAAKRPPRPSGASTPDPAAATIFAEATARCASISTFTVELALTGRSASERVRGRLHAGFAAPDALRLEAVAPFGPPVFLLAGDDKSATLLLPRENAALTDAEVPALLERMTGLPFSAGELRALLSACLFAGDASVGGRAWSDQWRSVSVGENRTVYLRALADGWAVAAVDFGDWRVDYAEHRNGWPRQVRVQAADTRQATDLSARLDQLQINIALDPAAFNLEVPAGARRLTLDELTPFGRGPDETARSDADRRGDPSGSPSSDAGRP